MRFHVTATLFFNVMVSAIKKTDVNKTLYEKYAHGYCYFSLPIEFQYYFYISTFHTLFLHTVLYITV